MNILFYIPSLSQDWGGIRQYSKGVLEIIAKDTTRKYFIYHNSDDSEILKVLSNNVHLRLIKDCDVIQSRLPGINKRGLIRIVNFLSRILKIKKQISIEVPDIIDSICDQFSIDIIHCPYQFIPKTNKAKLITTLHDVQELHFPEFFTPEVRADRAVGYMDYLFRADRVIVSYNHVKKDIVKYFQISEKKIDILLIDMNDLWINNFSDQHIVDIRSITDNDDFLLYPANTWRHKNHLNLLKAVATLRDQFNLMVKVICTGSQNQQFENIKSLIRELNLEKQVVFTGIVSEEVLYSLYKGCKAVVVPSLYEAGSFPLYESILLDVPVICSNVTSLPETILNVDALMNPFDVENIAFKMKQIWTNDDFRFVLQKSLETARDRIHTNDPFPVLQEIYTEIFLEKDYTLVSESSISKN
jgi:glycosyltransferase involved in cell wall biosynthesis